jgi:hypothetical protein
VSKSGKSVTAKGDFVKKNRARGVKIAINFTGGFSILPVSRE